MLSDLQQKYADDVFSSALEIFEIAGLDKTNNDALKKLELLCDVLNTPLCRTIFHRRLLTFSDYTPTTDLLSQALALDLINTLSEKKTEEERIHFFFDTLAKLKAHYPSSQRDIVYVDILDSIVFEINAIRSHEDLDELEPTEIFDKIKYQVANHIESEDVQSTRNYDRLMTEIKTTFENNEEDICYSRKRHRGPAA